MTESKKRGRPTKAKTETTTLSPNQERARKAWVTRKSKLNSTKTDKPISENGISIDEIKAIIETAKFDISVALKKLTDIGLCVVGVGIKTGDKNLKYDSITIKFQI